MKSRAQTHVPAAGGAAQDHPATFTTSLKQPSAEESHFQALSSLGKVGLPGLGLNPKRTAAAALPAVCRSRLLNSLFGGLSNVFTASISGT